MTKLDAIRRGLPLGQLRMGARPIGVYQAVIDSWEEVEALGPALASICQYHCDKTFADPDGFPEFEWYPYNVYPVEFQAIRRIRQDQGRAMPEVNHPLLDSALARHPAVTPVAPADDLLDRVTLHSRKALAEEIPEGTRSIIQPLGIRRDHAQPAQDPPYAINHRINDVVQAFEFGRMANQPGINPADLDHQPAQGPHFREDLPGGSIQGRTLPRGLGEAAEGDQSRRIRDNIVISVVE